MRNEKLTSEASPKDDSCMKETYISYIIYQQPWGILRSANACKEVARIWNSHWGLYKPGELHAVRGDIFCLGKNMERHEKGRKLEDLSFFWGGMGGWQAVNP